MVSLLHHVPAWNEMRIHETSPAPRGVSRVLANHAPAYVATQFWPNVQPGAMHNGVRCENLEAQTFESESFDLVISQDVMEHIFHPNLGYREVFRTLKPGGHYIHTTPIYKWLTETSRTCAY